jgi:hypothetical protein
MKTPDLTAFGFEHVMRKPDYSRFPAWYAGTNRFGAAGKA